MKAFSRATIVVGIAAVVVGGWLLAKRAAGPGWVTLACEHMATTISLTVPDDGRAAEAAEIVSDTFGEVDEMMSEWKPGSPLATVNEQAGVEPVEVPPELFDLIALSLEYGDGTDGAFDITWAALWGVWDFKAEEPEVPDAALIAERRALVDYRRVQLDPVAHTVFLPENGMKIGLGGIAKGYAADVAAERLRNAGFEDFLIVAGGQVYAAGEHGGRPWRVGIRDPRGWPGGDFLATIELHDQSASTSGDYERYFEIDGVRYHHILDPRTGWPSGCPGGGPRSVTVVADRGVVADAMSTAGMIVDEAKRAELADRFDLWMYVVGKDGMTAVCGKVGPRIEIRAAGTP